MAYLELDRVAKQFGAQTVVDDFSLAVAKGEFISFLGPSGCGKTTTLQMIAGFLDPTRGAIRLEGNDLNAVHTLSRRLRAGIVWVNCFEEGDMTIPFGGVKGSGFGRDKSLHAMEKFTDLKTIWIALS